MKHFVLITMILAMFSLTACESLQNSGTKQTVGTASGAVIGGVLGSRVGGGSGQLWATGAGVLLGGLLGSEIGRSLDRADQMYLGEANNKAHGSRVGETISWNNPQSGNHGTVTPTNDGYSSSGRYCREYTQTIYVGGRQETATGTACQNPDGSWQVMN